MKEFLRHFRDLFVSLKLTLVLLVFAILLVFAATLDQTNLGVWGIQQKWFRTFVVFHHVGGLAIPIFPGGYLVGGLMLVNLVAGHLFRFKFGWRKSGVWLAHFGLILLLVGELLSGLWQEEYFMRLDRGETKNYAESYQANELVLIDKSAPDVDAVVAIPDRLLERKSVIQHPKLPFRVVAKAFYPNSSLQVRAQGANSPTLATLGAGLSLDAVPVPVTYKENEANVPSAFIELAGADSPLGTFLVSPGLTVPQTFDYAGRSWQITLRARRLYQPFSLTLQQFSHDRYAGTEIPKNFSSRVRLSTPDGRDDREVVIYMNNPLRYAGLTFYQAGFANEDRTTILQVVRNPSWLLPYFSCAIMTLGLLVQFGIHLAGFVRRRPTLGKSDATASHRELLPPAKGFARLFPALVLLGAVLLVLGSFRSRNRTDFDLEAFGRLPTLVNGRLKPLDTVARTSLLALQGRQRVVSPDGAELSPEAWLLDLLYRPELADRCQNFEIVHPEVLTLFNLTPEQGAGKKRFSFTQLAGGLRELERQANLADGVEAPTRSPFQNAVIRLRDGIVLYQHLQASIVPPGVPDYLARLPRFADKLAPGREALRAKEKGLAHDAALAAEFSELSRSFSSLETFGYLLPIPPEQEMNNPSGWQNPGASLRASLTDGGVNPAVLSYVAFGAAWHDQKPEAFNAAVRDYRARLEAGVPVRLAKCDAEYRFNVAQPFYTSAVLYVAAFLLAVLSWLRWPGPLSRAAFWLVVAAFVVASGGIATRMWLESRPPVTNLYSSALFVGWGAVALCLVLESIYKNAVGSVAAGLIGFSTLLIAHHLSLGGDTLEMMRAVLDSNFWLATHVVTVTVGYSATFLAGFLALIHVARGILSRGRDEAGADAAARMIYGVVCFATLFSFVGTVLGGIWADQSWGRFWGWDPKENGALIIVLWNSLILHARWAGLVRTRGLMNLAIFGNIVTAWSWFGVNMLGVGLHSYGFMDAAFWWLVAFAATQAIAMLLSLALDARGLSRTAAA